MKEIRRYYGGEQLSATKLNDLVDALRCLCSEAQRLQKTRFTYGAQPINAERRYWAEETEEEAELCINYGPELICIRDRCEGTCRAAFELIRWGATEYYYITPGALYNGMELDQSSWSQICNTAKPLFIKEGSYFTRVEGYENYMSGESTRQITGWGIRDGILMMKDGGPTHRGGGMYKRGGYIGYGSVSIGDDSKVRVCNLPYHLMSGGVDSWVGGEMNNGIESSHDYQLCNSIKVAEGTIEAGAPEWRVVCGKFMNSVQNYPVLFVKGGRNGITLNNASPQWMILEEMTDEAAIPCYTKSGVRFWFCMSLNSTYLKNMGYAEVKWNGKTGRCNDEEWVASVPVAYAFRNAYSGYVECARILEEEVLVQPTVYITAPDGVVILCGENAHPLVEAEAANSLIDAGCGGGAKSVDCVADALWVSLPKTISRQRFFPWGNICSGFYVWDGCRYVRGE